MVLPWPSSVPFRAAVYGAVLLLILQLALGTAPAFAVAMFAYLLVTVVAFNLAGGLYTYTGSYIALQSLQSVSLAQVAKIALLQPADSNLRAPLESICVYLLGEISLLCAILVTRKFKTNSKPIFDGRRYTSRLLSMSIASTVIGVSAQIIVGLYAYGTSEKGGIEGGTVLSYLHQLPLFVPLGVMLGTVHIIKSSGGARSLRSYTLLPMIFMTVWGFFSNSKSQTYEALLIYLVVCMVYRYRFTGKQIGLFLGFGLLGVLIIFPFIQYVRRYALEGDIVVRAQTTIGVIQDVGIVTAIQDFKLEESLREESGQQNAALYYGKDMGFLDRVSLIENEDALVYATEHSGPRGMRPYLDGVLSMTPRFLWPDKVMPPKITNEMGHAIGLLGPDDDVTAISFSLFGSAFYLNGWYGPTIATFLWGVVVFGIVDRLYGSARYNVFALIPITFNLHAAPETNIVGWINVLMAMGPQTYLVIRIVLLLAPLVEGLFPKRWIAEEEQAELEGGQTPEFSLA